VIVIFYGVWLLGLSLLLLDIVGRFVTSPRAARILRRFGLAAVSAPAVLPILAVYGRWWDWSGITFPAIAHGYAALGALFIVGVLVSHRAIGRWLARLAYAGLLALAAIPSFVLLPLAGPTVGLAGLALASSRK